MRQKEGGILMDNLNPQSDGHNEKPTKIRIWLVVILLFTLLIAYLDRVNISVIMADARFLEEMGLTGNPVKQGLLMTFFLIAYGLGNVFLSPVGDKLGPRKAMSIAILSWTVPVIMGALSRSLPVLYASRFILGAGEAMHYPMQIAFVKNWFPLQERGKANSVWVMGTMIGPAIAMPVFALVVAAYDWRASFWLCAVLGIIIMPIIWFFTADKPSEHKWVNKAELDHILAGQKAEAERQEKTVKTGTVWQNYWLLAKNPDFVASTVAYWSSVSMWWGIMSWLPQYLKVARGFSWAQMGFFSSLPYVLGIFGIIFAGFFADKIKRSAPVNCLGLGGCALFILLGATATDSYMSAMFLAVSIFFKGVSQPMSWTVLQAFIPANIIGQAAGLQNGSSQLVGSLSPLIIGYLISVTGTYTAGLMYLVVFGFIGTASGFYLVLKKY